jgi:hypothetical protein
MLSNLVHHRCDVQRSTDEKDFAPGTAEQLGAGVSDLETVD